MIVVFDFDKTLTCKDTLFGFYRVCSRKDIAKLVKFLIYAILMVAHKLKFVSNENLKWMGVIVFLRGKSREHITKCANEYSNRIRLSPVYHTEVKRYSNPYIISASFVDYLIPLFPAATVFGSEIEFDDNKVKSLKKNCYGKDKPQVLEEIGIDHIDILYTDSISDLPLAKISKKIKLVKGDRIIGCHNLKHFIELTS